MDNGVKKFNNSNQRIDPNAAANDLADAESRMGRAMSGTDTNVAKFNDKGMAKSFGDKRNAYDVIQGHWGNNTSEKQYQDLTKRFAANQNRKPPKGFGKFSGRVNDKTRTRLRGGGSLTQDKRITAAMFKAGHSPQGIKRAVQLGSRATANMSQKEFNKYWKKHLQPVVRSQEAIRGRKAMVAFKQKHGIPQSYKRVEGLQKAVKYERGQAAAQAKAKGTAERRTVGENRRQSLREKAQRQQRVTTPTQQRTSTRARSR